MDETWEVIPKTEKKKYPGYDNLEKHRVSWKPGQSGNPKGKTKGTRNRATILKEFLAIKLKKDPVNKEFVLPEGITLEQSIALSLIQKARSGDVFAIREIYDTIYGKLTDKLDQTHNFTKMGRVKADVIGLDNEKVGSIALEFDVGRDPPKLKEIESEE